jgi:chromosomal replication initiation ATPase DnaA
MTYTFDTFVVSAATKDAWSAAVAVANDRERAHNPLVLFGRTGSGKSHLLHAIEHAMRLRRRDANILRLSAAIFASSILDAFREDRLEVFQSRLASLDAPRLKGAYAVEVGYPDGAARAEIARRVAATQRVTLPEDVMRYVTEQTTGSAPELRSMILRIATEAQLTA